MRSIVLIVAQPSQVQEGLKLLLATDANIAIMEAHDLASAVITIQAQKPALVLLDGDLPGQPLALITSLRTDYPDLPIVVLTDDPECKRQADALGAVASLIKGYPAHKLLEIIQSILFNSAGNTQKE